MDSKILPVNIQKEFNAQLIYAFPLCVLLSNDYYSAWFHENYLELFITQIDECEFEYGIFDSLFYAWRDNINPLVMLSTPISKYILDYIEIIHPLIKDRIDKDMYCVIFLDEFMIPSCRRTNHFVHEFLVYGYDDKRQIYNAIAFENRIFNSIELHYDDVQKAFVSGKEHIEQRGWAGKMFISLKTLATAADEPSCYPFDLANFISKIRRYRKGVCREQDAFLFFQNPHHSKYTYYYGVQTGHAIATFFSSLMNLLKCRRYETFVTRLFGGYNMLHMFCDHREGLHKRFAYLYSHYYKTSEFAQCVDIYKEISTKCGILKSLNLKMQQLTINSKQNEILESRLIKILQRLIEHVPEIISSEVQALDNILLLIDKSNYI